jgi:hypothetical protein
MRQFLLKSGGSIFGENISTVIYGRGKDIWKTFNDFSLSMEPYLLCKQNEILYLGDLDYEGIFIFEQLQQNFKDSFPIHPFVEAYCYMADKCSEENMELPKSKEGQNKNLKDIFMESFSPEYRKRIMDILEAGGYIPQEIINLSSLLKEKTNEA